jgi:hypothetical protein
MVWQGQHDLLGLQVELQGVQKRVQESQESER